MYRIATILFLFFATTLAAQPPSGRPTMEERLKKTGELLQREAQLNADQQKKLQAIFRDFFTEADKLHKNNPPPPPPAPDPKVKQAMDKLVKERDQKVEKLLTTAQFKKYKEAIGKLHPPGPPPPQKSSPSPR